MESSSLRCNICQKKFSRARDVTKHIKTIHEASSRIKCLYETCPKTYKWRGDMAKHYKKAHNDYSGGAQPGPSFEQHNRENPSSSEEVDHQDAHQSSSNGSSGREEQYQCTKCGEFFYSLADVEHHEVSHGDDNESNERDIKKYFSIVGEEKKYFPRFKVHSMCVRGHLKNPSDDTDPIVWFQESLAALITHVTKDSRDIDLVGISIRNLSNSVDRPIGISLREKKKINMSDIWRVVEKVIQSNTDFGVLDKIEICSDIIEIPNGNGRMMNKCLNLSEVSNKKKSIVMVMGDQNCLAKALVLGKAKADADQKLYDNLRKSSKETSRKKLDKAAEHLMREANVDLNNGGGIHELNLFQNHLLRDYTIIVYEELDPTKVFFKGEGGRKTIHLLYNENHYDFISNPKAAFGKRYFCPACKNFYDNALYHNCGLRCTRCKGIQACKKGVFPMTCKNCKREFNNTECFEKHKKNKISKKVICDFLQKCIKCGVSYSTKSKFKHVCGHIRCKSCYKMVPRGHLCHIQKLKSECPTGENVLFVFYDFESRVERIISEGSKKHEPNLVVTDQFCYECEFDQSMEPCSICGIKRNVIFDNDCVVDKFLDFLKIDRSFNKIICIAHFSKGYDSQFILAKFIERNWVPKVIMKGTEILSMTYGHLVFLDSINFLPMALNELSNAFNLSCSKGFYPHLFNKLSRLEYVGPYPDPKYYGVNHMKTSEREKFFTWYETVKHGEFDNKKELIRYCESDVKVLRQACQKFRRLFIVVGGVDPFLEAITLASAANKVYRRHYLPKNTIGLIPPSGYRLTDNQSKEALEWLIYMEARLGIPIQHAGNGREVQLPEFGRKKVDGYHEATKHIFEYFGCYWHGCPICFKSQRNKPLHGQETDTMNSRYNETVSRIANFKSCGYRVTYTWGCKCNIPEEIKLHPSLKERPLSIRESMYGGRCEAYTPYYKVKDPQEKIKYIDICSLYPYICKYSKMPIGHPKVYVGKDCPKFQDMGDGIVKCTVLPPDRLTHPVLPIKLHNKLMFVLCRVCTELLSEEPCKHSDEQRSLTGTWIIDEIRLAEEMGYKITQVHEFWEYRIEQFNPKTREGGLFASYVNTFLKIKAEASGWPSWVSSEEDKDKYIKQYDEVEGIILEKENISKNPGMRLIAKLLLNTLYGKFCQLENKPQTAVVKNREELLAIISDSPEIIVSKCLVINDNIAWINYSYREECAIPSKIVNVSIASYVTSAARVELYSYLKNLGDKVYYCDTDSIVYLEHANDEYRPKLGDNLGQMTDELAGYGREAYGVEWVCGGPKNYSLSIKDPISKQLFEICKVKGIRLNYSASQKINLKSMKKLVQRKVEDTIQIKNPTKIKRKPLSERQRHPGLVVTEEDNKKYKVVYNKRRRIDNETFAYGYK